MLRSEMNAGIFQTASRARATGNIAGAHRVSQLPMRLLREKDPYPCTPFIFVKKNHASFGSEGKVTREIACLRTNSFYLPSGCILSAEFCTSTRRHYLRLLYLFYKFILLFF